MSRDRAVEAAQIRSHQTQSDLAANLAGDRKVFDVEKLRGGFGVKIGETGFQCLSRACGHRQNVFARQGSAENNAFDVTDCESRVVERGFRSRVGKLRAPDLAV